MAEFEAVIGLEVHTQLKTNTKLFCSCSTKFGGEPNSNICPQCSGQPGSLPVLNKKAVTLAIRFGLASGCQINKRSVFSRKNYYYPDSPSSYQISQYDQPIVGKGTLAVTKEDSTTIEIGIHRAHLEGDAGKLVHQGADGIAGASSSFVDLNRCQIPLLEIVSEPDMHSGEEACLYLEKIKELLQYAGISDANMEEGKLRCDANISIRPVGSKELGTRTEVKNMNSFRSVERAINSEIKRQKELTAAGEKIVQETRNFDDKTGLTTTLRSKEEAHDYRYFPEPDLLPLNITDEWIEEVKKDMPELPEQIRDKYKKTYGLSDYDAEVLTLNKEVAAFFDKAASLYDGDKKQVVNWITTEIMGYLKERALNISQTKITPEKLVEMLKLIDDKTISGKIAKDVVVKVMETGNDPKKIVEESGAKQITDEGELTTIIQKIIDNNHKQLEQYKAGKTNLKGFFVGQAMKETKGLAAPQVVNQILDKLL